MFQSTTHRQTNYEQLNKHRRQQKGKKENEPQMVRQSEAIVSARASGHDDESINNL